MTINSAVVLLMLTMTACGGGGQDTVSVSGTASTSSGDGCGNLPCEARARYKKPPASGGASKSSEIQLSTQEQTSLNAAVGAANSHIHADAPNGQLVFSPDNGADHTSASHLTGDESEISLTEGGAAKKVVATPAANALLQKRVVR
jgi:hypothetical protein